MNKPARLPRRALHGVLLVDKPIGWTSNDALQKAKPAASKGQYLKKVSLSSTMGAGVRVDQASLSAQQA